MVEDHQPQRVLHRGGEAGLSEHTGQGIEAEFAPDLIECTDVTERQGGVELHLRRNSGRTRQALVAQQSGEQ